jgi:hypothetical protein
MSSGHPWPDIIIRQQNIMGLSYNDMFILVSWAVPGLTQYYADGKT